MTNIAENFGKITRQIGADNSAPDSYTGVLIHAYRRKKNKSLKQMSNLWKIDELTLFRIELGYGSLEEINLVLSIICAENQ